MAEDAPSTSAGVAGRVIDAALDDAKADLKKSVQRMLVQKLRRSESEQRRRPARTDEEGGGRLVRVNSMGTMIGNTVDEDERGFRVSTDAQIAKYLRDRGYEYTLSVLMAEANVPDSKVLKSIAIRLNDSRSRLVLSNPEFQTAVLQVWDETERKYNEKLRQYVIDWEMKQTMQLKQMERMLRRRVVEEEQESKRQISNRLLELETKEKDLRDDFHERAAAFEQQADQDKRRLLADARELDGKRQDLQSLETEFNRQVENEQNRIRMARDSLNQLSAELKRQQLQVTFQMDEAVKEARRQEQARYAEKLQQISRKEEKIRGIFEKAKQNRGQVDALKFMLTERDSKMQELEMIVQQYKTELIKYQDRLREKDDQLRRMNDYELLKTENARLKDQSRLMREQLTKEKLQLQRRSHDMEAQIRELEMTVSELAPDDENPFKQEATRLKNDFDKANVEWKANEANYKRQLEDEKTKNEQLKSSLDNQTSRLQDLAEEVKKLQFQLTKRRVLADSAFYGDDGRARRTNNAAVNLDETDDMDEEEPTPDYLKEAKRRLRLLERETETFDESMRRYQQKAIDTSAMAVWQARATASAIAPPDRGDRMGNEPRFNGSAARRTDQQPITNSNHAFDFTRGSTAPLETRIHQEDVVPPTDIRPSQPAIVHNQRPPQRPAEPAASAEDDWETKLRKREEERRRRDEELRRQQEEELGRLENERQAPTSTTAEPSEPPLASSSAPAVDPVLQKYMQMVLEQRQKEKEAAVEVTPPTDDKPSTSQQAAVSRPTKEQDVEVGEIKEPSSESDFDW